MSTDRYRTLGAEGAGSYREKASRFLAWAFPIADEAAFKMRMEVIAKEHHASRHVCYAWVLGADGQRYRANDAGEPAGTAGAPILRRIRGMELTQVAVVVVRYFGGTLLGKGGLVHAYDEAARLALAEAPVVERVIMQELLVRCTYAQADEVRAELSRRGGSVLHATFGEPCVLRVEVPAGECDAIAAAWSTRGMAVVQGK